MQNYHKHICTVSKNIWATGKRKTFEITSQFTILDFVAHHTFEISREVNTENYDTALGILMRGILWTKLVSNSPNPHNSKL